MPNGFPRSPRLFKGALVELTEKLLVAVPNIIVFQYNPQSLTRNLEPFPFQEPGKDPGAGERSEKGATAQPFDPVETFSLTLELDATDAQEDPITNPQAVKTGVADRIAAMEMLLYPQGDDLLKEGLLGSASDAMSGSGPPGLQKPVCRRREVPIVLFVWGSGRIVPVRLTTFSVEEQFFSPRLFPVHAKVTVGLQVLTPGQLLEIKSAKVNLAIKAYEYTLGKKQELATENLTNSFSATDSILSMLPF